jgi:uncharacterized protein (TIGR00730 family)
MPEIRSVTVYAASAPESPPALRDLARRLGDGIAARGWLLVYGGARIGLMGELADAALARGGRVEGVILDTFARVAHQQLHVLDTVGDMRSRKAALAHRGDAFVTLPGGFGTLEELSEILVERQLGFHAKPLVLVNFEGFYDPLLALIERQIADGLVRAAYRDLLTVVTSADEALAALSAAAAATAARGMDAVDLRKIDSRG